MAIVVVIVPLICAAWTGPVDIDIRAVAQRSAATQTCVHRSVTVVSYLVGLQTTLESHFHALGTSLKIPLWELILADVAKAEFIEAAISQLMQSIHHVVMTTSEGVINPCRFQYR